MKAINTPKIPDAFDEFNSEIQKAFSTWKGPIFKIDQSKLEDSLYKTYLNAFSGKHTKPMSKRQEHTCRCCQAFIEAYGGIYTISDERVLTSLWSVATPRQYKAVAAALEEAVLLAASRDDAMAELPEYIGSDSINQFTHFYLRTPYKQPKTKVVHYQQAQERFRYAAANGFTLKTLDAVEEIMALMTMHRTDEVLPILNFMQKWHKATGPARMNLLADAHDGLTHPRNTMLGTLVSNIRSGDSPEVMKRKFAALMHPLVYQRPTEAPKAQAIDQAELLFYRLGLQQSLHRRNLRRDEIPDSAKIWTPSPAKTRPTAVFAHISDGKSEPAFTQGTERITWAAFKTGIMPFAAKIETSVYSFRPCTLTTATFPEAAPILAHDKTPRNPVSWWLPNQDVVTRNNVNVTRDHYNVQIVCITKDVRNWYTPDHGTHDMLVLDRFITAGCNYSGLFPQLLRHELREVRSVIEQHNRTGLHCGAPDQYSTTAIKVEQDSRPVELIVTTKTGAKRKFLIDRFA